MAITDKTLELKEIAIHYSNMYTAGQCTREEARENIMPYLDLVNQKSVEIAKKYNMKPKKISFITFIR